MLTIIVCITDIMAESPPANRNKQKIGKRMADKYIIVIAQPTLPLTFGHSGKRFIIDCLFEQIPIIANVEIETHITIANTSSAHGSHLKKKRIMSDMDKYKRHTSDV